MASAIGVRSSVAAVGAGASYAGLSRGGAAVAGGAAIGRWGPGGASLAAPSKDTDTKILRVFLALEQAQEAFYRAALRSGRLSGGLHTFAARVAGQEAQHVAFLSERVGGPPAAAQKSPDFGRFLKSPQSFHDAAIELEEATIAVYIGQGANLTRDTLRSVATLVSVEARQVAWIRDLAGVSPAPRAADPPSAPQAVVADLRRKGFLA
jgi:hypothetical protein